MKKHEDMLYIWNVIISGCILILVIILSTLSLSEQCRASTVDEVTSTNEEVIVETKVFEEIGRVYPLSAPPIEFAIISASATEAPQLYLELTEEELYLISQILYLEGRGETVECQEAIVSVILNRMTNHNLTVNEVIFANNQFSTADNLDNAHPSEEMIERVRNVVEHGPTIPEYITYFRAGHYHEWKNAYGEVVPWDKIDNTYFSYDVKLKEKYDAQLGEE